MTTCTHCKQHIDALRGLNAFKDIDLSFLEQPQRSLITHFPVQMDDGSTQIVTGYRIQYNNALGPTKGGLRIHHEADEEEVAELAFLMTLKTSLAGLPYGGAKGAIQINPKDLSPAENERVIRRFIQEIAHFIGEDHDIPAPDVNTTPETMMLMLDEYEKTIGVKSPATFTGKPVDQGGSEGRDSSTSRGGFLVLEEHLRAEKMLPATDTPLRVALQGFGNVGSHLARMLYDAGYTVVAVSDSQTGLYDAEGLNIPELLAWKSDRKSFTDRSETKIENDALLELDVDILVPAALGGVITAENASRIQAPIILEMANAPIAPEADTILAEKNHVVIPDILANAGGVIVSYFEWIQNRAEEHWNAEKVDEELSKIIVPAYQHVREEAEKNAVDFRTGSYIRAIKRIAEAENARV